MNLTEFIQDDSLNLNVNLEDLIASYQKFMDREKFKKPLNTSVTKREYSIEARIEDIRNILNKKKKIEFIELFEEHDKDYLIVTFLSILTMSKMQEIILQWLAR